MSLMLAAAALAAATAASPASTCPAPVSFAHHAPAPIKGYRVVTAEDGKAAIEPIEIEPKKYPFPGSNKVMSVYGLAETGAKSAKLVIGAADLKIPAKASVAREMILVLEGSSTILTPHGSVEMKPGDVVVFEDIGAVEGHSGLIGPCGYVGLAMALP